MMLAANSTRASISRRLTVIARVLDEEDALAVWCFIVWTAAGLKDFESWASREAQTSFRWDATGGQPRPRTGSDHVDVDDCYWQPYLVNMLAFDTRLLWYESQHNYVKS